MYHQQLQLLCYFQQLFYMGVGMICLRPVPTDDSSAQYVWIILHWHCLHWHSLHVGYSANIFLLGNCGIFFPTFFAPFSVSSWILFFYLQFFVPFLCLFNVYLFFYLGLTHYVTWINHNTCIHFIVLTCQRSFCIIFLFWHRIGILVVFFFFFLFPFPLLH